MSLIYPLNPVVHFWLHHAAHCTALVHKFCVSRKGWTGGSRWGCCAHGSCQDGPWRDMVSTGWTSSYPDCIDRLRKHYSDLAGGWFLAGKAAWSLCQTRIVTIVNEWVWLVQLESSPGFSFRVRTHSEMKICLRHLYMLKVVSSEKKFWC